MTAFLQYEFLRNAILAGLLVSFACAIVGTLVVVRRMVFLAGGIAHASFGGIGIGYLLGLDPILSALGFSVLAALGMGAAVGRVRVSEDSAIGILWAIGMALGVLFVGLVPGYVPDLFSYLFGNILMVPRNEVLLMALLDLAILMVTLAFYKELVAVCFDPEFSWVVGVRTQVFSTVLLVMVAVTCVMLIRTVGIVLVLALITIPSVIARHLTSSLRRMMALGGFFGFGFVLGGLLLSYLFDVPSGATIVLLGGGTFLLVEGMRGIRARWTPSGSKARP